MVTAGGWGPTRNQIPHIFMKNWDQEQEGAPSFPMCGFETIHSATTQAMGKAVLRSLHVMPTTATDVGL